MSNYETTRQQDHRTMDTASARRSRWSVRGGSTGKPGRCFASVTAPQGDDIGSPKAQIHIRRQSRTQTQRVEDNAFHLSHASQSESSREPGFTVKQRGPESVRGFTLAELLVSMVVLVILVFLATQLVNSAATVTILGHKIMDADSEARQVFDRMAVDFAQMVKRTDVDYYCKTAPFDQWIRNDQLAFYSAVPGYYPSSGTRSPLSLVAYRVNSNCDPNSGSPSCNKLERLGKGLVWNGVSAPDTPAVFLPLTISATWPYAIDPQLPDPSSPSAYEVIGPDVFRFEYFYMLKGDVVGQGSPLQGYPCAQTPCSVNGWQNVAAIGVVIAVIDPRSKVLLTPQQIATLNSASGTNFLIDFQPGMSRPGALRTAWQVTLNKIPITGSPKLPAQVVSGIRVYERYFYLPR